MMLKSKQAKANNIPAIARISNAMTSPTWKVFTIFTGVPSGGTPTICNSNLISGVNNY